MDDSKFDNIIKNKIGEYEDRGFDPAALSALHHQLAAVRILPWHTRYTTELLVGLGMLLITLTLLWGQWYWGNREVKLMEDELIALRMENSELRKLKSEIGVSDNVKPDTIRIIEVRPQLSPLYASLANRIYQLESARPKVLNKTMMYLGAVQDIPAEILSVLEKAGLVISGNEGGVYLTSVKGQMLNEISGEKLVTEPFPAPYLVFTEEASEPTKKLEKSKPIKVSLKTIKELENHYQTGVGFKLGPTMSLTSLNYKTGSGSPFVGVGGLAEMVFSPALALETGFRYMSLRSKIRQDFDQIRLSHFDGTLGELQKIEIDTRAIEIPINLKYRYPLSMNTHLIVGTGYAGLVFLHQDVEYKYALASEQAASIIADNRENNLKVYPGTVNFSLGVDQQLLNKKSIEASLFYQKGIGNKGIEQNNADIFGIKGTYWFTIR